ncbi:ribosomal protein S18-alanine N-acetyltransferase [Kordiimonas gwangyangensis]|uniref:ribosomal protein S18-alanine N-acetyltransferase n=1 Tax=Kordiimonas gwangyangensis TaxID=288022 RepID=UPI00038200D3|nr:ribosomal protein S18-alanine N-acetyltransferase [Kordiimonas gwangyangensis]
MTFEVSDIDVGAEWVLPALEAMYASAFTAMDERAWTADEFRALIDMPGVFVKIAHEGNNPVGFILYRAVLDEAELITVAVFEGSQGKGVASLLMRQMISHLRYMAVTQIFLEVREDNSRAIKLYEQFGFTETGKRSGYYMTQSGSRFDALCLCLFLNNSPDDKEK